MLTQCFEKGRVSYQCTVEQHLMELKCLHVVIVNIMIKSSLISSHLPADKMSSVLARR